MLRGGYGGVVIHSVSALFGLILGLVGASLDFYSGYQLIAGSAQSSALPSGVGMPAVQYVNSGLPWGAGVAALGVLVASTSVASVSVFGAAHMRAFGALMVVYGLLMVLVGFAMGGLASAMGPESLSGFGMLLVGGLMAINGFMMLREATYAPAAMY
ncbi:MAG: hypothetical protein JRN16_05175 [Nitrososphaerota archaeon]|nr:hypothetical protein [Nitrososphaerota archaeon]MDG6953154.1 hypothetical protein [Nitrososphaerota archaeon]MDG6956505.1 hypothetical protein [Nitrososphaerota archaeon]MDG6957299.1 hypothetical protein [Nitrososphaerota archaeon]MDG6960081.1 hypothetical protein [Nitrososphaerota archaeon]